MTTRLKIAVLGPGGVGAFLGAALARAGADVVLIAREPTADAINRGGIEVDSARLGPFVAHPTAITSLSTPADALVVATKAKDLGAALERVEAEPALVVPLLNGLDHLATLRDRFGPRAVAASIRIESFRTDPNHVSQTSDFLRVDLATANHRMRGAVEAFATTLNEAHVHARVLESEADAMWGKLVRLNALALMTSAYDLPLGPIRSTPELRAELEACVEEAAAVAIADGADVRPRDVMAELDDAHDTLGSSMQRDIAAGAPPELDAIAGSVLRAAARHGIACPTVERLTARVAERLPAGAPR
ncbi:MAG TPA: 2-dehydropantoate 2-reductase [Thermoleophilaceae bacterium]|nr:2-dehydropantoate 2-reductase [Thermoleophilaceae bacterium]